MSASHLARNLRAYILAVWLQTDLQSVNKILCLAPDQKIVRTKKVANNLKINLAPKQMLVFFVEKNYITFRVFSFTNITCDIIFFTIEWLPQFKPEKLERVFQTS